MANPALNDFPLVSILCRSMNRPELVEALLSVENQSYENIEIILVDATGKGLDRHKSLTLRTPLRELGLERPLNRPAAANLALANSHASYMLFLDEDDWIAPNHIEMLVACLQASPNIGVAYSSTQKTTPAGVPSGEAFRIAYDPARLRRDNFIPIHSAMFRKHLIDQGCHFDESLDIFEDWDFWLQLSQLMPFQHIDEITAFYRQGGDSNTASDDPSTRYQGDSPIAKARVQVFSKWLGQWTGEQINETLGSLDQTVLIESLHKDLKRLNEHAVTAEQDKRQLGRQLQEIEGRFNSELNSVNHKLNRSNQALSRRTAELNDAKNHINRINNDYQLLINSISWKITKPIRFAKRQLLALGAGKVKTQLQHKQVQAENEEHIIQCNLDIPNATQNEFPEQLSLQGWACSPEGVSTIEAFVDGKLVHSFGTGISRPDIAESYPSFEDAFTAGVFQEVALPDIAAGKHTLTLTITDKAGNTRTLTQEFSSFKNGDLYNNWYWRNTPEADAIETMRAQAIKDEDAQLFHLVLSLHDDDAALLSTLSSIAEQAHLRWMIHVCGQSTPHFDSVLDNAGITTASTQVHFADDLGKLLSDLSEREGWTILMQAGETLAPHALYEMNQALQGEQTQLLYSDHDKASLSGKHFDPCFTPQWAPNHLYASNYVGDIFAVHNACLLAVKGLDFSSIASRFAALLTLSATPIHIKRIAKVLWSAPQDSPNSERALAHTQVLQQHLQKHGAQVISREHGIQQVRWPLNSEPKVSIIIPTMGNLDLIKPCIDSMLELTSYKNFEVVILDNSRGKNPEGIDYLKSKHFTVVECNEAFNWARLNNIGVKNATGELYLFLNDDIEIIDPLWLEEMVRQAIRPEVGTVGALLYYPNGALQHTGVLLVNYGGGGIHLLHKRMPSDSIYRHVHETTREVSANTGACLMLSRNKFEEINGFDEELAVVGNDVDLCLRLLDKGYRNIWSPDVKLIHHESISRKTSVPKENEKAMWKRWSKRFVAGDEYYNPNLSAEKGDFTLQVTAFPSVTNEEIQTSSQAAQDGKFQPGVNLIGYTRAEMGIGEGARSDAKALDAADEPFGIICFQSGNPSRMTDLSWQHKEIEEAPYDVSLLHINPDHALQAISELPSEYFNDHYRIGYWAWELPEIPEAWAETFVHFDEIWVPSSFVQDAVAMRSPIPVVRIPHAVEVKVDSGLKRQDFGLPEDAFLFLAMFDTYSMPARKNPFGAINAFKQAFAADDLANRLVLKVNNPTAEAIHSIKEAIGEHRNVIILDKVYSRQEVNALISNTDCYVSLHRSEGFGFGPAEAMALGKAILATNWSGNTDYMRPNNCMPIDYQLKPIEEDFGPYKKGQIWAEPDEAQAANAMKTLANDPALAVALGKKAKATIESEFSPKVVGEMMRKRLQAIRKIRRF